MINRRHFLGGVGAMAAGFAFSGGLWLPKSAWAAMTNRYANFDLATGNNDGTSEADAWRTWDDMAAGLAAGHYCYIKRTASRHDPGANKTLTAAGSNTQPLILEGYKTTTGDGGADGLNNYFQYGAGNRKLYVNGANTWVRYMDFQANIAADAVLRMNGLQSRVLDCKINNVNTLTAYSAFLAIATAAYRCWFLSSMGGSNADRMVGCEGETAIFGCLIDMRNMGSTGEVEGIRLASGQSRHVQVVGNVIWGRGSGSLGIGIRAPWNPATMDDRSLVEHNSVYACDKAFQVNGVATGDFGDLSIVNNATGSCNYGIFNAGVAGDNKSVTAFGNAFHSATADFQNLGDLAECLPNVSLTGDPFTNPSAGDFTLNATAGAGAACRGAAFPRRNNGADIGAMQLGD